MVFKSKKSLYELKQAPRNWIKKIDSVFLTFGLQRLQTDPNIYVSHSEGEIIIIGLYVDDQIIATANKQKMVSLKAILNSNFEMKDLGPVNYFLGMEITHLNDGSLKLTQAKDVEEKLLEFRMGSAKVTPHVPGMKESESVATPYRDVSQY